MKKNNLSSKKDNKVSESLSLALLLFGLLFGGLIGSSLAKKENPKQSAFQLQQCPYILSSSFAGIYQDYETNVKFPPNLINNPTGVILNEKFNPLVPPEGESFFPPGVYPWSGKQLIDVDQDGKKEEVLYANLAMNHTPQLVVILKNGNVIYRYRGINVQILEASEDNGFVLNETLDWLTGKEKTTRFVYKNNMFFPVWNQITCGVKLP